ncbi:hypothetical protein GCM10018980_16620 [Streptomyces capoamus]|uniref:Uncharacterized protein n=1 Tax=Streptomyces capoamus TaxID=68183 RepID=A0A919C368_9ACTN|nr:hypothetical protein GCM10010501_17920 [Streptomyces libani subsp. rufus]GHG41445.1 hypothetical protein GCM10018980_16620 [Streptomyces capoamus]
MCFGCLAALNEDDVVDEHLRRSLRAVRLRAQRGPLLDGRRLPPPPRRRPRAGPLGWVRPGIDISAETPKVLTVEAVQSSDLMITMDCGDACPYFPGNEPAA